jgi:hypothetical protein
MEQESVSKKEKYEVDPKSFEHHVWLLFEFVKQFATFNLIPRQFMLES